METYFENLSAKQGSSRKLAQDLRILLRDTEALVTSAVAEFSGQSQWDLRARVERLKASCLRLEDRAAVGFRRADEVVRRRPLQVAGLAFVVGLWLGLGRRR